MRLLNGLEIYTFINSKYKYQSVKFWYSDKVGMILKFYIVILPACQCLSEKHSRQYGYNHYSEKTASLGVKLMAGRHFDI